jgi:hypothetical protein
MDNPETCSYCNEVFDKEDDYLWTCSYNDASECSHWCGRDECPTTMRLCSECVYGVCAKCVRIMADDEALCPTCVDDLAVEPIPRFNKREKPAL